MQDIRQTSCEMQRRQSSGSHVQMRPIPGHSPYYAGSDGGIYRSGRRLSQRSNGKGYMRVSLSVEGVTTTRYSHRLICAAWNGPPPIGMECRHLDGDRGNNRPGNLCWSTKKDNEGDKVKHGTLLVGERSSSARLSAADVLRCRQIASSGSSVTDIARRFGVTQQHMSDILNGRSWAHLPNARRPFDARRMLSDAQVRQIRDMSGHKSQAAIAALFGVSRNAVYQIIHRVSYRHVD